MSGRGEHVLGLRDGRYFAIVLFCHGDKDRDWLASVWRDGEGPWHIDYRFRYYATCDKGDAFSGKDEKSEYSATARPGMTETEVCTSVRLMGEMLVRTGFNDKIDVVETKSDDPAKVFELLQGRPWFHVKPVSEAGV